MKQYLDLLREVHEKGNARPDRTGTGTVSVFGRQMRFDLQKGFPLLTTKRVPMKSVIGELLWFLSGSTNIKNLHKDGITIWDEWRAPWTKDRKLVRVPKKSPKYVPYEGNFSLRGVLSDKDSVDRKLANTWVKMMSRCYNPSAHNYRNYGAKGASVCLRWHDPINFINDAKLLPHWWYKETFWDEFELDKDYYGANQYGPETCVWLHHKENVPTTWVYVKDPEGREEYYCGYSEAAEKTGFSRTSLHRFVTQGLPEILKGKNRSAEGWEFKTCSEQDMLVRRELIPDGELGPVYGGQWRSWKSPTGPVDQIKELIDGIRNQPFSRRHIVTSWAVHDLGKMALPPCHCLFQFYVEERENGLKYLSCQLYQRKEHCALTA